MTNNKVEPLSSPYFPDIPDLIAQNAAEDTSKNYDASANPTSTGEYLPRYFHEKICSQSLKSANINPLICDTEIAVQIYTRSPLPFNDWAARKS